MKAYQVITDRVVQLLEQGTVPWRKPWSGGSAGCPRHARPMHGCVNPQPRL